MFSQTSDPSRTPGSAAASCNSGPSARRALGPLFRRIVTHNPFYLISAGLVLYGLNKLFGMSDASADCWTLLAVLAGYTALTAFVGFLIVQLGRVWDDARSILLIVLLLFIALSVSFDEILIREPDMGAALLLVGLGFAIALTEAILWGLRIRLGPWFRLSLHAGVALLCAWPLLLGYTLQRYDPNVDKGPLGLAIYGFSVAAALGSLLLLPGVRLGRQYARNNGTPWRWPWFPWAAFVVLGAAVCARSYSLTVSFYPVYKMLTPFDYYFLAPLFLAWSVLLLEMGLKENKTLLWRIAVVVPLLSVGLSLPPGAPPNRYYQEYLTWFQAHVSPPAFLAAAGAAVFYLYAMLRRAPLARLGLVLSLMLLAILNPAAPSVPRAPEAPSVAARPWAFPELWPLVILSAALVWQAMRRRRSHWTLAAWTALLVTYTVAYRDTWLTAEFRIVPAHLLLAGVLWVSAEYKDGFQRFLERFSFGLLTGLFMGALGWPETFLPGAGAWDRSLYHAVLLLAGTTSYRYFSRQPVYLYILFANLGCFGLDRTVSLYDTLLESGREGGPYVFWGGVCFVVATLISLVKGRVFRRTERLGHAAPYAR